MTAGLPWFKCYPRNLREGMVGLTREERGTYITLLTLIYERGGPIPDDESWLAAQLWCSTRAWRKDRAALIVKGKLFDMIHNGEPCLMNGRAALEISRTSEISTARSEAGIEGGKRSAAKRYVKTNENNVLGAANASPVLKQTPSKRQADIIDLESSVANATAAKAAVDPNKQAWDDALGILTGQGGLTVQKAREFFGKLLSAHGLEARDMLAPLAEAFNNQTQDPKAYLTRAAIARAKRRAVPAKRVGFV